MASTSCTKPECPVASGGEPCLEGLPAEQCPNYVAAPPEATNLEDAASAEVDLDFFHGDGLTDNELLALAAETNTRLILFAGPAESGKTCLIAELYDQFAHASRPEPEWSFSGSLTLRGFEKVCHHARLSSGNAIATSDRSREADQRRHLHLVLTRPDGSRVGLVFSDLSGEIYQRFIDTGDAGELDTLLRHADVFALVLDGDLVSNVAKRHVAVEKVHDLTRRIIECNLLNRHAEVAVVTTKNDLLDESDGGVEWHQQHVERLKSAFPQRRTWSCSTAARPPGELPTLGALLDELCADRPNPAVAPPTTTRGDHPFDRFSAGEGIAS